MEKKIYSYLQKLQISKQNSEKWNITWRQGIVLSTLITIKKPHSILEIGTSNGFSSLFMLKDNCTTKLTTLEINKDRFDEANNSFKILGLDSITSLHINALEYLENFKGNSYDVVFVDALQQDFKKVIDLLLTHKVISKKSWIIFDNVDSHNSTSSTPLFLTSKGFELNHLEIDSGFLVAELK